MTISNMSYDELCLMTVLTMSKTLWVASVPVTLRFGPMIHMVYTMCIIGPNRNVTGTEATHKVLDIVNTVIRHNSSYDMFEMVIYLVYIRYIASIYQAYM